MFTDTVQVATVAQTWLCTILYIVAHALNLLGMIGTLCKSVRHQHIQHVGIGKSHTFVAAHLACLQLVLHLGLAKVQCHRARLCTTKVHVDKQIVGRIKSHQTVDYHTRIISCYACNIANTLTIHHQLHLRILHPYIPVGGFDTVNHCFLCCTHRKNVCHNNGGY